MVQEGVILFAGIQPLLAASFANDILDVTRKVVDDLLGFGLGSRIVGK